MKDFLIDKYTRLLQCAETDAKAYQAGSVMKPVNTRLIQVYKEMIADLKKLP